MERPDFFSLQSGSKSKLPFSNKEYQERLKKLSLKGYFNMDFNGVELNIELTHSYKGICDVLSART